MRQSNAPALALTDRYPPRNFEKEARRGPGCGVREHPDSCLCDVSSQRVVLEAPVLFWTPFSADVIAYASKCVGYNVTTPARFADLSAEALPLFDLMNDPQERRDMLKRSRARKVHK